MLAEHWNGLGWALEDVANPVGVQGGALADVACSSVTQCLAVGAADGVTPGGGQTMSEERSSNGWASQTQPDTIAASTVMSGVSCRGAGDCTAVGSYDDLGGTHGTAQHWDGASWSLESTAAVFGATADWLGAVACEPSADCMAVGAYDTSSGDQLALAEQWNGVIWTVRPTASLGTTLNQLVGVACPSTANCVAVGDTHGAALAERWDGSSWTAVALPMPSGAGYAGLSAISCPSATACTAVGSVDVGSSVDPLIESWDGASWAASIAPLPAGSTNGQLRGVSCTSAGACTAVGSYVTSLGSEPLAEGWDGTSWTVKYVPIPYYGGFEDRGLWLDALSCVGEECLAVGTASDTSGTWQTLAARWDGASWSLQRAPTLASLNGLAGVSCVTSSACTAVGSQRVGSGTYAQPLAEWYSGPAPPTNSSPPRIVGTATEGYALFDAHGSWTNYPTLYSYQWERCGGSGESCSVIAGATAPSYTLGSDDVGHTIRVAEYATNAGGTTGPAISSPAAIVQASTSTPRGTAAPTITDLLLRPDSFHAMPRRRGRVKRQRKYGTTVSYLLNERAAVRFTIYRVDAGRQVRRGEFLRCAATTRQNRHLRPCRRLIRLPGMLTRISPAGIDRFVFSGVLGRHVLAEGKYLLVATATDNGRTSRPVSTIFTVEIT
jgi:hypothetical protein